MEKKKKKNTKHALKEKEKIKQAAYKNTRHAREAIPKKKKQTHMGRNFENKKDNKHKKNKRQKQKQSNTVSNPQTK